MRNAILSIFIGSSSGLMRMSFVSDAGSSFASMPK